MTYDPQDARITAYVFGELNDADRTAFELELQQSDALRLAVQQTRDTLTTLTDELSAEPSTALAAERRAAVEAAINSAATPAAAGDTAAVMQFASHRPRSPLVAAVRWALVASLLIGCGFLAGAYWSAPRQETMRQMALHNTRAKLPDVTPSGATQDIVDPLAQASTSSTSPAGLARSVPSPDVAATEFSVPQAPVSGEQRLSLAAATTSPASPQTVASSARPALGGLEQVDALRVSERGAMPNTHWGMSRKTAEFSLAESGAAKGNREYSVGKRMKELESLVKQDGEALADRGAGPGSGGDKFEPIVENEFREVKVEPLSTFSIDVDTASYSKVRQFLMQHQSLPRPDAVRIEELLNYFTYDYQPPRDETPFAANVEVAECPWTPQHRLVRIGLKGREIERAKRPTSNLVFLLDVSGSMNEPNKLPLVKHGMKMLVNELGENDRVAIVVYAGAAGLVLPATSGDRKQVILDALDQLQAGGSTNGGQGIRLAYQTALDNFIRGGTNRVILCSDGDFNVGVTGTDELVRLAEQNAKTGVFLTVLGFGMGNHNDSMMEQVSNKGNGNYAFIDTDSEARKVLVEQMSGTLVTIAKDVKIQVEFNPTQVAAFRLIGYENRLLAAQDFNDDKKDAGEIGAGHTVTALYEIVPVGAATNVAVPAVDELKYQRPATVLEAAASGELLTLKLRYKQPEGDKSVLLSFPVKDSDHKFGQATREFRFAAAVASFGLLLRDSKYKGELSLSGVLEIATEAAQGDKSGYREEFLRMVAKAKELRGE